jgi:hypothetical protein
VGPTRELFWKLTLTALSIASIDCSGKCSPRLEIGYDVIAPPGHQTDACVATIRGARAESFDIPTCDGGCAEAGVNLVCPDPGNPGLSLTECARTGDRIGFSAEGKDSDAIFNAVGSTSVSIGITCGGVDFSDAGQGGAGMECSD